MDATTEDTRVDEATAWELATMEDQYRAQLGYDQEQFAQLGTQVRRANDARNIAEQALDRFKQRIVSEGLEYADQHDMCDKVEEFFERMGLAEYMTSDVDVEVSMTVSVRRIGRNEPDEDDITEAIKDYVTYRSYEWRIVD